MKHLRHTFIRTAVLMMTIAVVPMTGCAPKTVIQPEMPPVATPAARSIDARPASYQMIPKPAAHGSLWSDKGALSSMFINAKARCEGDIVTIKIVESSKASNKATTNTGRTTSMSVGLSSLFGIEGNYPSSAVFNPFSAAQSDYESAFDGSGTTARSGALTAYITARIVQVLPNGNLLIEGNREVRINNENQIITLTGQIRPRDISADNVVQSTYIADARISYSGTGIVNEQQRPGWLARLLDSVWPF